jgi:hypothetical protein
MQRVREIDDGDLLHRWHGDEQRITVPRLGDQSHRESRSCPGWRDARVSLVLDVPNAKSNACVSQI